MNRTWKYFITIGIMTALLPLSAFSVTDEEIAKIRSAMPDRPVVKPAKPRAMLVFSLSNGFKHSCIPYWAKALDIMAEKTGAFTVEHSNDMNVFTPETLSRFDVVCFNNTTKLVPTDAQKDALMTFVKSGKGIVGIHAATDNFYEWPEGAHMMGGIFQGHPWTAPGTWAVKIDDPTHPLMKPFAGKGFKVNDEIYRTNAPYYSRDKQRVLMSLDLSDEATRSVKDVTPEDMDTGISWIKSVGNGRLFYCSLGHNHYLTWTKPVLEHYLAGIQYAMGDLKVDDTPLGEPKPALDPAATQALIDKIKTYDWGKSRQDLTAMQQIIRDNIGSDENLKRIEGMLEQLLTAEMNRAVKDFACRELSVIGTVESVPELAALLDNPETEHMARYALERIPDAAADMALLSKLAQTDNPMTRIGIVTSLGVRRFNQAVTPVCKLAADKDQQTAQAAISALGNIGTSDAAMALNVLRKSAGAEQMPCVLDAMAVCANHLVADGKETAAMPLYELLYAPENSALIRIAGLTGIAQASPSRFRELLPSAVVSEDAVLQAGAIRLVAEVKDTAVIESVAALMPRLSNAAKLPMLAALGAAGSPAGRAAAETATQSDNASVRMAAYQALGRLGSGDSVMRLANAAAKASDRAEREAAREALYRLKGSDVAAAIEKGIRQMMNATGGDMTAAELIRAVTERGIGSLNSLLFEAARSSSDRAAQEAMRGLQAMVTEQDVQAAVDLLADKPSAASENVVVAAADRASDKTRCATVILSRLNAVASPDAKVSCLRVLSRLGDSSAAAAIRQMRTSPDKAVRDAAFRAMVDWPGRDFFEEIRQLAVGGENESEKVLAFRAYVRLLSERNDASSGQIVSALSEAMKMTDRPQEKRLVLGALSAFGSVDALNVVVDAMKNAELKTEAEAAVVAICEKLMSMDANTAADALRTVAAQTANLALKERAKKLLADADKMAGFILNWQVAGPYMPEQNSSQSLFETAFAPEKRGEQVQWKVLAVAADANQPWLVNLGSVFKGNDRVIYVRTVIMSPKAADAVFEIGSDDGVKIWLNGQLVHANNAQRPVVPASDKASVKLTEGENTVMMKITQSSGDWGFCLRVTNTDGTAVQGLGVK